MGVVDENDAAKVAAALTPLNAIAACGASTLLIHHPRKEGGAEGTAARGSGVLPGFVDIILELKRYAPENPENRRRNLNAFSRFDETPAEVVLELVPDEGYRSVGRRTDAKQQDRLTVLEQILPDEAPGLTADEVKATWPDGPIPVPCRRVLHDDLKRGAELGTWASSGTGRKGAPYRYFVSCTVGGL